MQELGLTFYGYGSEVNPFSCRVVCGKCGAVCGKKSWKSRGVEFWQCNNRSKNHGVKDAPVRISRMKICLRVLLQRGTRLLRKENNIFQNGRKRRKGFYSGKYFRWNGNSRKDTGKEKAFYSTAKTVFRRYAVFLQWKQLAIIPLI